MSGPVILPLPALDVRITPLGSTRHAVWLGVAGHAASERVATITTGTRDARGWRYVTVRPMPATLEVAIADAISGHVAGLRNARG